MPEQACMRLVTQQCQQPGRQAAYKQRAQCFLYWQGCLVLGSLAGGSWELRSLDADYVVLGKGSVTLSREKAVLVVEQTVQIVQLWQA